MRIALSSLAAAIMSCLLALPAQALVLPPPPEGTCPLDNNQAPDRQAISYMHLASQTPGTLKALFAECSELETARLGRSVFITNYGAVFEQNATIPAGMNRAQAMQLLSAAAGLSGTIATQAINGGVPVANPAQRSGGATRTASYHGILKQSDQLLVLGSEQRHLGARQQYAAAAVTALTVVDNKIIAMNFFAPLENDKTFSILALEAESYGNSLLAANP